MKKRAKKRASPKKGASKSAAANKKAHWNAFRDLHAQVDKAWAKLKSDVNKNASPETILHDKNHLLLLLGECNYMARECKRLAANQRKR